MDGDLKTALIVAAIVLTSILVFASLAVNYA